jgi:hypothetical protein
MEWLTHNLIVVAVIVLAAYVVHLLDRVKRLEKPAENSSRDLVDAVNRMAVAILRPDPVEVENIKADDTHAALELIDHYIGYRLFKHTPALRRVLSFSIGVSLDFLREKTGITVTDLKGLEQYFSGDEAEPKAFWPAMSMVIEEWATHTVITDFSGRRDVIYPDYNFGHYSVDPRVIWKHALPGTRMFNFTVGGNLEIVLYHGSILFWARDGRFGRRVPDGQAENEYQLVGIPMEPESLEKYRTSTDKPNEDPEIRVAQVPWIRHYEHEEPAENFRWHLTVNDIVGYVANR